MQQISKPKTRRTYDAEFKNEVVKMLVSGQTAAYISKALGVSENLIYRWKNQNRPGGPAKGKKASGEQNELAPENQQLKDRIRQLETDRTAEAARDLKKSPPGGPVEHFQPTDLTVHYELIHALADTCTVETLCSVLGLSRTAYYGTGHPALPARS